MGGKKSRKVENLIIAEPPKLKPCAISGSLDPYDYGGRKIVTWNGKLVTKEFTGKISLEERELLAADLFQWYRTNGFPYPKHTDARMIGEWKKLKAQNISTTGKNEISNKNRAGMDIIQNFTCKQFYDVGSSDACSMVEAFKKDEVLLNVMKNRVANYGTGQFNMHGAMVRQGFRSTRSSAVVSNFNCMLAKYFYKKFSNDGDSVYDYSMGFGHRMIAALSLGRKYVACDPWLANIESAKEIHAFLSKIDEDVKNNIPELNPVGSETFCPDEYKGKFQLAFSSPPYSRKELYDKESSTQSTFGRNYEQWLNDWWKTVVKNIDFMLKEDGYFILNMVSVLDNKHNILDDMLKICVEFGFKEVDRYFIKMSQSHFGKYKKSEEEKANFIHKFEPIVVMQRVKE
jgi:hypothetical protein